MIKVPKKELSEFDDIWIYKSLLDTYTSKIVNNYLQHKIQDTRANYEGRVIDHKQKRFRLIGTSHYRPYMKLWDFTHEPEYWNQTNNTVFNFVKSQYSKLLDPVPRLLIQKISDLIPFSNNRFIALRGILNIMKPGTSLDPHLDGGGFIVNDAISNVYSATYYSEVEGEGGEFWDERGFIYKPENNSLLINIGNQTIHGVRKTSSTRLGMTIRFVQEHDLLLTGNTEDLLYKPN